MWKGEIPGKKGRPPTPDVGFCFISFLLLFVDGIEKQEWEDQRIGDKNKWGIRK